MGIAGSVTSAVSSTSVTLPSQKLTIIGAAVYNGTVGGYLQIPITATRNANFLFSVPIAVTTVKNPVTQSNGPNSNGIWPFTLAPGGLTLNYVGVGLTSGTFIFYYGTALPNSQPLASYASIVGSYTASATVTFSFPSEINIVGIAHVFSVNTNQTELQSILVFNTSAGFSVTLGTDLNSDVMIIPIQAAAAQSLSVVVTLTGASTATKYIAVYYA